MADAGDAAGTRLRVQYLPETEPELRQPRAPLFAAASALLLCLPRSARVTLTAQGAARHALPMITGGW